jgi:hypothetical protein
MEQAKSFNLIELIIFRMPLIPLNCPYCNAENRLQIIERTVTDKVTLKVIAHEETENLQIPIYELTCRLCLRTYELIKVSDYSYIEANLLCSSTMLVTFKTLFPNHALESIFDHIVGLTRPKKSLSDRLLYHPPHLHVCFELDGKRAYVDCEQISGKGKSGKSFLRGLDIGV